MIDFENLQEQQGYIENSVILDAIKDFIVKARSEYDEIREIRKQAKIDKENDIDEYFYDEIITEEENQV